MTDRRISRPEWERRVRAWARSHGATHAVIDGCGPRKRMRIVSTIARIRSVHGNPDGFSVHGQTIGGRPAMIVRDTDGRVVAQIGDLVRETHIGFNGRGEPLFEDRPVIS